MKRSVHNKIFQIVLLATAFILSNSSIAQGTGGNSGVTSTELVFKDPVLVFGDHHQEGAVYRFSNVGIQDGQAIDAEIKLRKFSRPDIVIHDIDHPWMGWEKAFQPRFGLNSIASNENWYIDFEMIFYKAGTNVLHKIKKFDLTALDIDGDGRAVTEYAVFENPSSMTFSPVSYLANNGLVQNEHADGVTGNVIQGPIETFWGIDTSATQVMVTYTYLDTDRIRFRYGATSGETGDNYGGEYRLNSVWFKEFSLAPVGTLPVKLTEFNAILKGADVQLAWTSELEENFSHFIVQRSADGKNYKDIATVFAAGGNGSTKYTFKDKNVAASGLHYYRIVCVDKTAETAYSSVRTIRFAKENAQALALATYPNPVTDQLKVTLPTSFQGKKVTLELYNANGAVIRVMQLSAASQTETLQLGNQSKGFYLVKATCEGQVAQQRIVKN
jgi:hypothetical protein